MIDCGPLRVTLMKKNITFKALSESIGISQAAMKYCMENGFSSELLDRICVVLSCNINDIVRNTDESELGIPGFSKQIISSEDLF